MPHGSRPDFCRHTEVESCGSSTFDVASFIIENNWILTPPSSSLSISLLCTHTYILPIFTTSWAQLLTSYEAAPVSPEIST